MSNHDLIRLHTGATVRAIFVAATQARIDQLLTRPDGEAALRDAVLLAWGVRPADISHGALVKEHDLTNGTLQKVLKASYCPDDTLTGVVRTDMRTGQTAVRL
jgi:hypothetical protein